MSIPTGTRESGSKAKLAQGICHPHFSDRRPNAVVGCARSCSRFRGSPALFFVYKYIFCLGFLDGVPGLIYCGLQGIQFFHIKAKVYELKIDGSKINGSKTDK